MNRLLLPTRICLGLTATAVVLLTISLAMPLWQLRMEAPQYRDEEALKVAVYPGALKGDLAEIRVLNQYIGVHVPTALPQLQWLPVALEAAGVLGVGAVWLRDRARSAALVIVPALLSLALLVAALQAQGQMYDIGHKRDAKTKLVGVKDFNPPLIGKARVAQFEVESGFGSGAYLIASAILLQLASAWLSRPTGPTASPKELGGAPGTRFRLRRFAAAAARAWAQLHASGRLEEPR
jgi:copper chaperone NosL